MSSFPTETFPTGEGSLVRLATLLRNYGLTVWWDYGLEAGKDFEEQILREIHSAKIVVVLWCFQSVQSEWVRREAELAGSRIFPVQLQLAVPPPEFARLQAFDLKSWRGSLTEISFSELVKTLCVRLGSTCRIERDTAEELEQLPRLEPLPLVEAGRSDLGNELASWLGLALPTLSRFRDLYGTMVWKEHEPQRDVDSFVNELRQLVRALPPFPAPNLSREPSPIHRQGLLDKLREYISTEIHDGKPIPDSYRLEPTVSELVVRPGILSVCWSRREGFGRLPEGRSFQ